VSLIVGIVLTVGVLLIVRAGGRKNAPAAEAE